MDTVVSNYAHPAAVLNATTICRTALTRSSSSSKEPEVASTVEVVDATEAHGQLILALKGQTPA